MPQQTGEPDGGCKNPPGLWPFGGNRGWPGGRRGAQSVAGARRGSSLVRVCALESGKSVLTLQSQNGGGSSQNCIVLSAESREQYIQYILLGFFPNQEISFESLFCVRHGGGCHTSHLTGECHVIKGIRGAQNTARVKGVTL